MYAIVMLSTFQVLYSIFHSNIQNNNRLQTCQLFINFATTKGNFRFLEWIVAFAFKSKSTSTRVPVFVFSLRFYLFIYTCLKCRVSRQDRIPGYGRFSQCIIIAIYNSNYRDAAHLVVFGCCKEILQVKGGHFYTELQAFLLLCVSALLNL